MNRGGTTSPRAKTATNGAGTSPHTETGVGLALPKRDFTGAMMRVLSGLAGSELAEKYGLRKPIERVTYQGTKTGFRTLAKATRTFNRVTGGGKPRRLDGEAKNADFFDLTPTEEQAMIVETVREFASEVVRPAAAQADRTASTPPDLGKRAAELGISLINVPEELEGAATHRAAVTNALVAEELSHGDMGLALPLLASNGVAVALTQWGDADQQQTYLPAFTGEHVTQAAVVISEPRPLFDPFQLRTTATATPSGYTIEGVKSFVPAPADSELFIVGAQLDGKPTLFVVESDAKGVSVQADPSMGLRGAGLGRL
ncbi:MAG: acyl-CoA dehydrogenase family protein, partial [Mycobacterium sp.]|nr:acyl-CoA dehydrogenase family protein [Mycobacterium sp.]